MKIMISFINVLLLSFLLSCSNNLPETKQQNPSYQQLKDYWYNGEAELSSYDLKQARYGEMRDGKAVLIFVTEDFSTKTNTKADRSASDNVSVLKLNATRKFNTGVYPYSMMNSTFFPFLDGENSIKVSTSSQEWCGHTYLELIDNGSFDIYNASYFQSEAQKNIKLQKSILEDDIWTMIRLNPNKLPTGTLKIIPSFFYLRFSHCEISAYSADMSLKKDREGNMRYTIAYPELDRVLTITFKDEFPYQILGWEDSYASGWGEKRQKMTTSGTLIKTIRSKYWSKNSNADKGMRSDLGLE